MDQVVNPLLAVGLRLKTACDDMPRPASGKSIGRAGQGGGRPPSITSVARSMASMASGPSRTEIMDLGAPSRANSGASALPAALSDASLVSALLWQPAQHCFRLLY